MTNLLPTSSCQVTYDGEVLGGASKCQEEDRNRTVKCAGGVTLRPCCVGLLGDCVITTKENCSFQEGYWHADKVDIVAGMSRSFYQIHLLPQVLCSEVGTDCFKDICEFTWIHRTIGQLPSQGLRFISSMFLYEGVIHLLLIGIPKLFFSWKIETRIG